MGVAARNDRLALPVLWSYGIGEVAVTISMVVFGLFILFFYSSVMKLPATLAGIGAAAGLLWDAIIDPYIGYRSDNHRGRLGRRHGYMLVGALLTGPAFWLLLSPPQTLGPAGLFAWMLLSTLLFRFASAVFRIPYLSLGAELSEDYHKRTSIVGFRSFFGLCGTLAAATLSFMMFFPNRVPGVDPKLDYAGYPMMGLVFGSVMTVAGLLSVAGTFGHRHGVAAGSAGGIAGGGSFLGGFASAWRNAEFRRVWLGFTLFFFGVVVNAALAIHYFTWYVRIADSDALSHVQLCFYLGALAGVVGWVCAARRSEKRPLCVTALVATAVLMALATALFGDGHVFATGNVTPLLLGNLLAGAVAGALWVLPGSMIADIADQDELATGQRREGLFFGLINFGEKIASGAALLVAGVLLDVFVDLVPGSTQDPGAAFRIGLSYGVLPALILVGAAVSIAGYGLDRQKVLAIRGELQRRSALQPMTAARDLRDAVGAPTGG